MKGKERESLFKTEIRGGNMLCLYVSAHCYNCLYGNCKLFEFERKHKTQKGSVLSRTQRQKLSIGRKPIVSLMKTIAQFMKRFP